MKLIWQQLYGEYFVPTNWNFRNIWIQQNMPPLIPASRLTGYICQVGYDLWPHSGSQSLKQNCFHTVAHEDSNAYQKSINTSRGGGVSVMLPEEHLSISLGANTQAHLLTLGLREEELSDLMKTGALLSSNQSKVSVTYSTFSDMMMCGQWSSSMCVPYIHVTNTHTHGKLPMDVWIILKTL